MHYRAFGRTGWLVSEISFGAWQLGGQWGAVVHRPSPLRGRGSRLGGYPRSDNLTCIPICLRYLRGRVTNQEACHRSIRESAVA